VQLKYVRQIIFVGWKAWVNWKCARFTREISEVWDMATWHFWTSLEDIISFVGRSLQAISVLKKC